MVQKMAAPEPITPPDQMSEADAEARLTLDRFDISAMVAKADHRREAGDRRAANPYYAAALRIAAARPSTDSAIVRDVQRSRQL